MKKETIKKRLDRASVCKTSAAFKLLYTWLSSPVNYKLRPCWTSGHGRFAKNLDYTAQLSALLEALKVRYIIGNDAPKGANVETT